MLRGLSCAAAPYHSLSACCCPGLLPPQALDSYTGRLAPRLALLGPEQLERNVAQRVLRWAGLGAGAGAGGAGGDGGADLSAMLAEDAAEVRCLLLLAGFALLR